MASAAGHSRSAEESDLLQRSRKKSKEGDKAFSHDQTMALVSRDDNWMHENMSFKEMVMRHNGEWPLEDELNKMNEEGEEDAQGEIEGDKLNDPEDVLEEDKDGRINFRLSASFKKKAWQRWHNSVFVKLLGKKLSHAFMKKRLENMWEKKDLEFALTAGPWTIFEHYLAICSWEPDFHARSATINRILAWVRLPEFPVEYVNTSLIKSIGDWLGKFVRVDAATTTLARGRFARLCVEIDLTKQLQADYKVEGKIKRIEYEGLHLICYECGKYGHRSEACPNKPLQESEEGNLGMEDGEANEGHLKDSHSSQRSGSNNNFVRWMLVSRNRNGKGNADQVRGEGKKGKGSVVPAGKDRLGTRFEALKSTEMLETEVSASSPRQKKVMSQEVKLIETSSRFMIEGDNEEGKIVENKAGSNREQLAAGGKKMNNHVKNSMQKMTKNVVVISTGPPRETTVMAQTGALKVEKKKGSQANKVADEGKSSNIGAAKKEFGGTLRSLVHKHKVEVVVLLEPRTHSGLVEEAIGFSGGIWILWHSAKVTISPLLQSSQFIHCQVKFPGTHQFIFTAIYANLAQAIRDKLWDELKCLSASISDPWLLGGDFNEIAFTNEKKGGVLPNQSKCGKFASVLRDCQVDDMGCDGSAFTWQGPKWGGMHKIYKRLDRVVAIVSWRMSFDEARVSALPRLLSDHNPLLIKLFEDKEGHVNKPFWFFVAWQEHYKFNEFLTANWEEEFDLPYMLQRLVPKIKIWNRRVFGDIDRRKNNIISKIDNIQKQRENHDSDQLKCVEEN
ncbi:uncharacterized protein LOC133311321 [Gastrolobium bilobum]|uniref:uncharacterized protein LOC133311321 n=1 Tax=Gastrolobium bilobum TaxID=150636 RepID=UPI002AB1DB62|nr:uncharacterized protein LOC133311321 [Gastrolobium bilobum]